MRQPIVIFLTLSISAILSHSALSSENTGDQFHFEALACRNSNALLATAQDLPDNIVAVSVKDEGNENDPDTNLGMVIQEYSISQTEVTARQYCTYLNQVATGENFELFYNEKMGTDPNVASIRRDVVDGKNVYTIIVDSEGDRGNFPIVYVNLYQAARFCNWLQNQNTPGLKGNDLTEHGAYTLNGKSSGPIARNPDAVWFIPTESEWYKPAYYKGGGLRAGYWNFANRSDWAPSNVFDGGVNSANYEISSYTKKGPPYLTDVDHFKKSVGFYNTLDMSGNVAEWVQTEETQGVFPLKYVARGGSWKSLYYGAGFENKCDVANWGVELSKWSRPAYDPTQGYDNVGFRVATSLLVNSAPPVNPASRERELTPAEVIEAPLAILIGIGVIFSGKKVMEYRQNVEAAKMASEQKRNREAGCQAAFQERSAIWDERTEEKSITQQKKEEIERAMDNNNWLFDEAVSQHQNIRAFLMQKGEVEYRQNVGAAKMASEQKRNREAGCQTAFQERSAIWDERTVVKSITQQEKEEIEQAMDNNNWLFDEAVSQRQNIRAFLMQKGEVNVEVLDRLQTMCNDHDAYAQGLIETALKIQEIFPNEHELWIPWRTAAMDASIETILLRYRVASLYYRRNIFQEAGKEALKVRAAELRKESNRKTVEAIEMIENYQTLLEERAQADEGSWVSAPSAVAIALEDVNAKLIDLKAIEEQIQKYEPQEKQLYPLHNKTKTVNRAYLNYASKRAQKSDKNILLLWNQVFSHDRCLELEDRVNLVNVPQLKEQFQNFLTDKNVTICQKQLESLSVTGSSFSDYRLISSGPETPQDCR